MQQPNLPHSLRHAIMLALGLTGSAFVGAGGCASSDPPELCANAEVDYATCWTAEDNGVVPPNPDAPEEHWEVVCFDGANGCDPCDADAIIGAAIERASTLCVLDDLQRVTLGCGPDPESEDCCYKVRLEGELGCASFGRPLRAGVERSPRVATLQPGEAWRAAGDCQLRRPRDAALLERLRAHWLEAARYEHASVAAFARVGMQLLSLGAPPALLQASTQAMIDEVRHARLCFGVAAAYGAPDLDIGALPIDGCMATGMDLESALREAIIEGALGEGTAAVEAREAARHCEDAVVRGLLEGIAEDEQRHALLAYQTVQWALRAHPERAREVVRACLRDGQALASRPAAELDATDATDAEAARYGLISATRRASLRDEVWTEVVAPILASMLQPRV